MIDKEYLNALQKARENLADVKERGEDALSDEWEEVRKEIFTAEEIAESDLRVSVISELIKARREQEITQKKFEEFVGIVEPLQKFLALSGKRLAVVSCNL